MNQPNGLLGQPGHRDEALNQLQPDQPIIQEAPIAEQHDNWARERLQAIWPNPNLPPANPPIQQVDERRAFNERRAFPNREEVIRNMGQVVDGGENIARRVVNQLEQEGYHIAPVGRAAERAQQLVDQYAQALDRALGNARINLNPVNNDIDNRATEGEIADDAIDIIERYHDNEMF
jgi:hypothetical protein